MPDNSRTRFASPHVHCCAAASVCEFSWRKHWSPREHLRRIAAWSHELSVREVSTARGGITERSHGAGEFIFLGGDSFEYPISRGTIGLVRLSPKTFGAGTFSRQMRSTHVAGRIAADDSRRLK